MQMNMVKKGTKPGKEKKSRGAIAATKRWGKLTRQRLQERVARLEKVLEGLRNSASATDIFGFDTDEEFRVDGATKWDRGIELLEDAIEQVQVGIVLHKRNKSKGDKWQRE